VVWSENPEGATPLTEEQRTGLKLTYIATRDELNEAEADNILDGIAKWERRTLTLEVLCDDRTVRDLHRDLFGDVWAWAGSYRRQDLNVGVEFWRVSMAVRDLVEDARYWFAEGSTVEVDLAAAKFHHRLVQIHPFPNGNGRHSRELTDLILRAVGADPFTWGSNDLGPVTDVRRTYIRALQAADHGELDDLCAFVRT
jgi:Fic-DOC domain mobile mystery protein B